MNHMAHHEQIHAILSQVTPWPMEERIALAYQILRDARRQTREAAPRHTLDRAMGIAKGQSAPPDDSTVRHWIEQHRLEKHG